jgi:alkylhydroperoxidase family enzyme
MPQLTLVPADVVEAWGDDEVRWYYREADRLGVPAATSLALESHDRAGMLGFCRLWWAAFHEGRIERRLMEEIRVRIAEEAGCAYCASSQLDLPEATPDDPSVAAGPGVDREDARRRTALAFTDTLALRPWDLGPDNWADLRAVFDEGEVIELAVFAAWQYSGPRMLRSWGAGRFKTGARAEAGSLPVALAYADQGASAARTPRPPVGPRPRPDQPTSAPAGWIGFLAPRPDLADAWTGFWRAAIDEGPMPPRIGQLIRADLAARLVHPAWAAALPSLEPARLDVREQAALGYARAMLGDRRLDAAEEATLAALFDEAELVGLGLATAIQIGAILVDRSRLARAPGPLTILAAARD